MPHKKNKKKKKKKKKKQSHSKTAKRGSFCKKCLFSGTILIALVAILLTNNPTSFLYFMNFQYKLLNTLDHTSFHKTYNAYSGTPASDFFEPLKEKEILNAYNDIKPKYGKIPDAFNDGVLFRIGSNQYYPTRTNIHVWEGDAMLHAFKFDSVKNSLSVSSSFMETPKLKIEKQWNQGIYTAGTEDLLMVLNNDKDIADLSRFQKIIKMAKFFLGRFIDYNSFSPFSKYKFTEGKQYFHCANTDILQWNNKLYAACEGSVFFEFTLDTNTMKIESVGFTSLNESWNEYPFIAHPKIDWFNNNNLMVIGHDIEKGNNLKVGIFDTDYNVLNMADVELNHAQEVHDMSSTENYVIIFDYNVWFGQDLMQKYGSMFHFENGTKSRIGVINKKEFIKGSTNVKWFEIDSCIMFHNANAWENGDVITIIGGRQNTFNFNGILHFDVVSKNNDYNAPRIYEWKLNMKTGMVEEKVITDEEIGVEMPIIHPLFQGQEVNYIWFNLIDYSMDGFAASSYGIIKYDVKKQKIVGKIEYENNGKYGSYEAVFVPKERKNIENVQSEDDGYLVNVVWDKERKKSNIQIFDAKTMDSKPVTLIELPYRIPGGFHSKFYYL